MSISGVGSCVNAYENLYVSNKNNVAKQAKTGETDETSVVKTETVEKSSNEEYLKSLQKQVPYIKLQIGYGLNTNKDSKVNYVDENGNFSSFAVVVRKDELNEKLRKEAQENAEKQIEKIRENWTSPLEIF